MKKNTVLISCILLIGGCTDSENSSFTPSQVLQANEVCKKDNTTLQLLVDEHQSGKYVKGLACKDTNGMLYKLEAKYGLVETNDCGRGPRPCMRTDYLQPLGIGYKIND